MDYDDAFAIFDQQDSIEASQQQSLLPLPLLKRENESMENKSNKKAFDKSTIVTDEHSTSVDKQYKTNEPTETDGKIVVSHQVRHQVALPHHYPYVPISSHVPPSEPARTYPFTLDPFQQTAIYCIQRNESVLVSAHTSAGKTVVAEYAIAQSLREKQRVIYTSPIKALSNQKYRELLQEFGDVGLMTGDVTINATASCLVMTTEILRSMLYRGSEVMREVAWVIFDEVHYMRDPTRGVVWEETLILLSDKVHFVFLSATIPNAMQFAEWICKIHSEPCHVVFTDYRPTPLQHYLFPAGGDGIHLVVDEKSTFREENFQKCLACLGDSKSEVKSNTKRGKKDKSTKGPTDLFKIIRMIMMKNYQPAIVFSFSKRECEANALILSKLDFNDDTEKELVGSVFQNAIHSLNEDDRTLPQIEHLLPLLKRGIGIHHSGLLPILKEVIEILFQEGLLKILFATETFSIGLNMPAKTVVFTDVKKFDGKEQRWLTGGEYIQMSGRAGRRGLDDRGIVILMITEKMEPAVAKGMLKGVSDALYSAFHLTYTMILNLLRVEGIAPETILEKSFYQFQNGAKIPELERELSIYEDRYDQLSIQNESEIAEYYQIRSQLDISKKDMRDVLNHPTHILPFLQPGRLVRINLVNSNKSNSSKRVEQQEEHEEDFGWGILINFQKTVPKKNTSDVSQPPKYIIDVLLQVEPRKKESMDYKPLVDKDSQGELVILPCHLAALDGVSSVRLYTPKEVKSLDARLSLWKVMGEVKRRFPDGFPLLDPIENMKITDEGFRKLIKKIQVLEEKLYANPMHESPGLANQYELYDTKVKLSLKMSALKKKIQNAESILQLDELKCRKRVLRRLGYTTPADVIELKGRVACEISAGDELMLTEMLFNGVFNELSVEQCVSLLSCFVFAEKSNDKSSVQKEELSNLFRILQETAKRIVKVCQESKLLIDEEEYIKKFSPDLMEITFAWCQGAKFSQICKMGDIFEGSIIRSMRRLEELLRQMVATCKIIGNIHLETKFSEGITRIKRDIIFAASLYL